MPKESKEKSRLRERTRLRRLMKQQATSAATAAAAAAPPVDESGPAVEQTRPDAHDANADQPSSDAEEVGTCHSPIHPPPPPRAALITAPEAAAAPLGCKRRASSAGFGDGKDDDGDEHLGSGERENAQAEHDTCVAKMFPDNGKPLEPKAKDALCRISCPNVPWFLSSLTGAVSLAGAMIAQSMRHPRRGWRQR